MARGGALLQGSCQDSISASQSITAARRKRVGWQRLGPKCYHVHDTSDSDKNLKRQAWTGSLGGLWVEANLALADRAFMRGTEFDMLSGHR